MNKEDNGKFVKEGRAVSDGCVDALKNIVAQMRNTSPQSCETSFKSAKAVPAVVIDVRDFERLPRSDLNHLWELGLAVSGVMAFNSSISTYPIFKNEAAIYSFLDEKGIKYSKTCTIVSEIPSEASQRFSYTPPPNYVNGQLFLIISEDCPYCKELITRPDVQAEIDAGNVLILDDDNPHKFKAMKEAGIEEEPAWVVWSRASGFILKSALDKTPIDTPREEILDIADNEEKVHPPVTELVGEEIEDWHLLYTPYLPNSEYSFNYLVDGQWQVKKLESYDAACEFLKTGFPHTKWTPVILKPFVLQVKEEIWVPPTSYTLEQTKFCPTKEWIWRVSVWDDMRQRTNLKNISEEKLIALKKRVPKMKIDPDNFPKLEDVLYFPSVLIVSGKRRKGKTAAGYKITELAPAEKKFVLGLPTEAEEFVPPEIQTLPLTTEVLDNLPQDCVVFIDEASLEFYAKENRSDLSKTIDKIIMKTAQKGQTLVFASHNLRKLLSTLVLEASFIIFKEPSRMQVEMERPSIMKLAKLANKEFSKLPPKTRVKYAFVISDSFMGMVKTDLPTFWTKKLSIAWRAGDNNQNEENDLESPNPTELPKVKYWDDDDLNY